MIIAAPQPPIFTAQATAYSPCSSGSINASGTHTRFGQVAQNGLPLGTKIKLRRPRKLWGRRHFYVRDRIGAHSQLDFFQPDCTAAIRFGRRSVTYEVVR